MKEPLRIAAVGDLLLCGRYDKIARDGGASEVFSSLRPIFAGTDLVVGNLECPLTNEDAPRGDKLCLKGDPVYAKALASAGIDILSLANNHATDHGRSATEQTISHLERSGIQPVGVGADIEAATKLAIREIGGLKIGFVGYCHASTKAPVFADIDNWGIAPLDENLALSQVEHWASHVDHLIILPHWGLEYSPMPTPDQVEFAHRAIDLGASAIIGHHSHTIQGIEHYKGSIIAYSLGNCTDSAVDWHGPTRHYKTDLSDVDRLGLALILELTRKEVRIAKLTPLWLNDAGQPEPAKGERRATALAHIEERSAAISTGNLEAHWEKTLVEKRVLTPLLYWWRRDSLWDKVMGFKLSQINTLVVLASTWVRIRLSRDHDRWTLFNSRNDTRPMPYAGDDEKE